MSTLSTHVLDTSSGRPAGGMSIVLESGADSDEPTTVSTATTDDDGRAPLLLPEHVSLSPGVYRLTFHTGDYFDARSQPCFYPRVSVTFEIGEAAEHYHVPLLVSPFGYSTYRGS